MPARRTIGVLSPLLGGFFFGGLLDGILQTAHKHGARAIALQTLGEYARPRKLMVDHHRAGQEQRGVVVRPPEANPSSFGHPFAWQQIEGWITLPLDLAEIDYLYDIKRSGYPVVAVSAMVPGLECPAVLPDNRGGVAAMVHHLIDHGHRRIAFIGNMVQIDIQQRYEGYQQALQERGLPFDPQLFAAAIDNLDAGGVQAAQDLMKRGVDFTAVVAATDFNAIGAMNTLQAAGRRCPEDVAVVGFDDVERAEYTKPPLTSVRQRFDAIGRTAAELLLSHLEGAAVPPEITYVATSLIQRRSCGCTSARSISLSSDQDGSRRDWQKTLQEQLVLLAIYPLTLEHGTTPTEMWPGVNFIVQALDAALRGTTPPDPAVVARAWDSAVALTLDFDVLYSMVEHLEHAGRARLARQRAEERAPERLKAFVEQMRGEMSRARMVAEGSPGRYLGSVFESNYHISLALLEAEPGNAADLSWLHRTMISWGCLGMWSAIEGNAATELVVVGTYGREGLVTPPIGIHCSPHEFPPREYIPDPEILGRDALLRLIPVRTSNHDWGVLALIGPVETRIPVGHDSMTQWATMLSVALEREALVNSLADQQEELRAVNSELVVAKQVAETANQLKTQFLANMSHELRTPLNAIINFTRFIGDADISEGALNEQQQIFQKRVLANGEHLLGLINDILDLSKIEAGKMELHCEELDMAPLLNGLMSTAIGLTKDKSLTLQLELDEHLPTLWGDKIRIRQIMLNLLSNAAKFTEQGGITVSARNNGQGFVELSVADTGLGISRDHQSLVFEEFRQVENKLSRAYQGTGLGLPICKKLVEMHGGTMWLESEVGKGATFYFTVPFYSTKDALARPLEDVPPSPVRQDALAPLIMVIDDNPDSQRILRHILESANYRVHGILESTEAMNKIRRIRPDLIILDILMPGINGWDLLAEIRADEKFASIPVLICSVIDNQRLGVLNKITGYISKPVRESELLAMVRECVDSSGSVLVVDDDPDARHIVRTILQKQKVRVVEANDGRSALAVMLRTVPDLVVLDLMMPGMDGFETLERMRAMPELRHVPVVILSAKDLTREERDWLLERAQFFLRKASFSQEEFAALVGDLVHRGPASIKDSGV